jgi:hypothetical protein
MDSIAHAHGEREHPSEPDPDVVTSITTLDGFHFDIKDGKVEVDKLLAYLKHNQCPDETPIVLHQQGKGRFVKRSGNYIGRTPADDEEIRFNNAIEARIEEYVRYKMETGKPKKLEWIDPVGKCEKKELVELREEVAMLREQRKQAELAKRRKEQAQHKSNRPVTNFINLVGFDAYNEFCKLQGLKKGDSVNGQQHLREFLDDKGVQENIKSALKDQQDAGVNIKMPKMPKNSEETLNTSWINIQNKVFDDDTGLGVKKSGQSNKRQRDKGGYKWLDA